MPSLNVSVIDIDEFQEIEQEITEFQIRKDILRKEILRSKGEVWADDLLSSLEFCDSTIELIRNLKSANKARIRLDNLKNKLSNIQSQKAMNEMLQRSNRVATQLTGIEKRNR